MNAHELRAVLDRYPELAEGLPEHLGELVRIARRILAHEPAPPLPWSGLPDAARAHAFDAAYPPADRETLDAALHRDEFFSGLLEQGIEFFEVTGESA